MLIGGVVQHHLNDHSYPTLVSSAEKVLEVVECAVTGMHRSVIGDVVSIIAKRRRKKRHQPQRVDPQLLQVIELLREAAEIPDPVGVAVPKGSDVDLVNDRVFVPKRVLRQYHGRAPRHPNYALSARNGSGLTFLAWEYAPRLQLADSEDTECASIAC